MIIEIPEERRELLANCGYELGHQWLEAAVEKAKDEEQMSNQIYILKHAAVEILAAEIFNIEVSGADVGRQELLDNIVGVIKTRITAWKKQKIGGGLDLKKPGERDETEE